MLDSGSNMEIIQLIIGIILIISVKFVFFRFFYNRIRVSKLSKEELKFDKVRRIYNKLKNNKTPEKDIIFKYANDIEKRVLVFETLKKFEKEELFPSKLMTREKASESYLANWLNMHQEYDDLPNEIECCETNKFWDNINMIIFKFKSYEPHLYAGKGWMYGYVGYNIIDTEIYSIPKFIVSNFSDILLTEKDLKHILD